MEQRIYVQPNGLLVRVHARTPLPPGCHWQDEDEDRDEDEGPHPAEPVNNHNYVAPQHDHFEPYNQEEAEMRQIKQQLAQLLAAQQQPGRIRIAAQKVKPLLQRLIAGTPCLAVWCGMVATFFWNSFRSLDQDSLANLIEVPEEFPLRTVAAALETGVFLVWTLCFRQTIRTAIRKEFEAK